MPPMAICTTRPSMPESDTIKLLPPPMTANATSRSRLQAWANETSSADAARTNHRSVPPTRSVVDGSSGMSDCTCGDGSAGRGKNLSFLGKGRGKGIGPAAEFEFHPVAGRYLSFNGEIGCYD